MKNTHKRLVAGIFCLLSCAALVGFSPAWVAAQNPPDAPKPADAEDKLVYADFETTKDNRPVSARGGWIQLSTYQENATQAGVIKGLAAANPPAPELVHLKKDDPSHAATFDYQLRIPNTYAGVSLEIHGLPDKDGKPVAEDVSGYKYLTFQLYATGATVARAEFISTGQGFNIASGSPQTTFRISSGFNTYKLPLKALAQPSWVQTKVDAKLLLKKLTQLSLTVYCEGSCTPQQGTVVVDNIIFQK